MLNSNEVEIRIKSIMKNCFELENYEDVNYEDTLVKLGVSSITFIKLIVAIEEEFDIEFDDKVYNFTNDITISDLIKLVNKNMDKV